VTNKTGFGFVDRIYCTFVQLITTVHKSLSCSSDWALHGNYSDLQLNCQSESKLCYDLRSVGQYVLVLNTHLGFKTRFLLLSDSYEFVDVGRSLWRENGSAVYNCRWSSPARSSLGPSPAGLVTIFYCLRFETPPTWRDRSPYLYPPGTGWPSYTPRHWVTFSSPPTTLRATVKVFEPASTRGVNCQLLLASRYTASGWTTTQKTSVD
jgi:hypothetical protein